MKKLLLGAAAAAMTLTGFAASAQPYAGHWNGGPYARQYDGYRSRDTSRYAYSGAWRTGQVYPNWRNRGYEIRDWRAYHLPAPRPGYAYYRDDNGDAVMAAIAGGVIGLVLGGALANHNDDGYQPYGYSPYGY